MKTWRPSILDTFMLDGLDNVPWDKLRHCWGIATDIPGQLRAIAREDDSQSELINNLLDNIWHQGTIYEATSYTVPFLMEMVSDTRFTGREEILSLIDAIAGGASFLAVHAVGDHPGAERFRNQPNFREDLQKELSHVQRAHQQIIDCKDVIIRLLSDEVPTIRTCAAHILSQFLESRAEFSPHIRRAFRSENESLAKAGFAWCLGIMNDQSREASELLQKAVDSQDDQRLAIAAAIARFFINAELRPEYAAPLQKLAAARWYADRFLIGLYWDWAAEIDFDAVLNDVSPDIPGAVVMLRNLLSDSLTTSKQCYSCIAHDLLELSFDNGDWRNPHEITKQQHEILRLIINCDELWTETSGLFFLMDSPMSLKGIQKDDAERIRDEMRQSLRRNII